MTSVDTQTDDRAPPAGVLLLGLMSGRPHAARFLPEEAEAATRAATLMGLNAVPYTEEQAAKAKGVAVGRIFASGRGFVPFCKASLYRHLCDLGGIDPDRELQPAPSEAGEVAEPVELVETQPRLPKGWDDLGPGCVCLASEGDGHGWYPVILLAATPTGFIVQWRDFDESEWGRFERRADELALLPPCAREATEQASA